MPEPEVAAATRDEPMIVRAHVTPWGFLVALPFALSLAYLGAWLIDADVAHHPLASLGESSISLLGVFLIGFSLYLFLVGVGELASYLKPAIEVVMDAQGIAIFGLLGERRMAWSDIVTASIEGDDLMLLVRARGGSARRRIRLPLSCLAVDPKKLLAMLQSHRPDLASAVGR
jgi:hypothetical protein